VTEIGFNPLNVDYSRKPDAETEQYTERYGQFVLWVGDFDAC